MNDLQQAAGEYLAMRRGLGFVLRGQESKLRSFVALLDEQGVDHITCELALKWAMAPSGAKPSWWKIRLAMIRGFARYCAGFDTRTEVPPVGLLPFRYDRRPPYLCSEDELGRLVEAARNLLPPDGLRPRTYSTLFGLLAATGLRIGEAIALDRQDVDLTEGTLRIRRTKFGKSRLVPVHESTLNALQHYARVRDVLLPAARSPAFFLSEAAKHLTDGSTRRAFRQACTRAGLPASAGHRRPTPHDLRHGFAVRVLARWYREGIDVERCMPLLATYLGHTSPSSTYWYLSAAPELLGLACSRLETTLGDLP